MTSPCILSHLTYVATTTICVDPRVYTFPKTNMKPENDEFQKGICSYIGLFSVPRGRCHRQCWRNGCWQCGVTRPVSGNLKLTIFTRQKMADLPLIDSEKCGHTMEMPVTLDAICVCSWRGSFWHFRFWLWLVILAGHLRRTLKWFESWLATVQGITC